MLKGFRARFLEPPAGEWYRQGLLIESARQAADEALPRLGAIFPSVTWDLLSRRLRPGFRTVFQIKRPFGGLRLLWAARRTYDVVAFFRVRNDRDLRLYPWLALLLMRPRRFFVFIERGDGLWLAVEDGARIRKYFADRHGWRRRVDFAAWAIRWFGAGPRGWVQGLWRALVRTVRGAGLLVYASATLAWALLLLAFFRLFYDTRRYRFRMFTKQAALHPERELGPRESPAS
jgi:hypothetical protein